MYSVVRAWQHFEKQPLKKTSVPSHAVMIAGHIGAHARLSATAYYTEIANKSRVETCRDRYSPMIIIIWDLDSSTIDVCIEPYRYVESHRSWAFISLSTGSRNDLLLISPSNRASVVSQWPALKLEDSTWIKSLVARHDLDLLIYCHAVCNVAKCEVNVDWARR